MSRIAELQEKKGEAVNRLESILRSARDAKRALSADETKTANDVEVELRNINATLELETRFNESLARSNRNLSKQEEKDLARFDYRTFLTHLSRQQRGQPSTLQGIELEMITEGEREAREAGLPCEGLHLPTLLVRRNREHRDMTATGTTSVAGDQGGMTIPTAKLGLADDFYNASVLRAAGATVLEGLVGDLDLPRLTAGSDFALKAENANADETSPLTAMLSLKANRLPTYVDISDRLLLQSSAAIEAVLRRNLTGQGAGIMERAFFHGTGTNEAEGIAGTSGIGSVAIGSTGGAPTFGTVVGLEGKVVIANAAGQLRYFINGKTQSQLKQTAKVSSTDSRMVIENAGVLNGLPYSLSNAIRSDLEKSTSGTILSAIFCGIPQDYVIGFWGGMTFEMVRGKTEAIAGLRTLVMTAYYDGGVLRPKSWAACVDAATALA
jgi:HK97 family phage major capsid protein